MPKLDFKAIRMTIPLSLVLDLIGYKLHARFGPQGYGPCPLRCSAYLRCASFYFTKNLWFCHHCLEGGNHLDLFCEVRGYELYDGALMLCQEAGLTVPLL